MRTHLLSHLNWQEVREITRQPSVALLPVGSLEQNGSACPLGTDSIVAEYFCQRLAQMTRSVVAPTIPYGRSEPFKAFSGTVWLRPETLRRVVADVCMSLATSRFTHILVVNNHGRNEPAIEDAAREVLEKTGVVIGLIWPFGVMAELARRSARVPAESMGHGGEPMASIIRHIAPDAFHLEGAGPDHLSPWGEFSVLNSCKGLFKGLPFGLYVDVDQVSDSGTTGNPTGATSEFGEQLLQEALSWAVDAVEAFRQLERTSSGG
jgi:creatinine amidohydrolase